MVSRLFMGVKRVKSHCSDNYVTVFAYKKQMSANQQHCNLLAEEIHKYK